MNTAGKTLPRFVPTLTEIVDPLTVARVPAPAPLDADALARQVQQQVQPLLARHLDIELEKLVQGMHATLAERWDELSATLHAELEISIQQAVMQAVQASKSQK